MKTQKLLGTSSAKTVKGEALSCLTGIKLTNPPSMQTTTEKLQAIATQIESQNVLSCWVGEYSAEDETPTLHLEMWRHHCISDLSGDVHLLDVVCEGDGRFSLQFLNPTEWRVGSDGRLYRH